MKPIYLLLLIFIYSCSKSSKNELIVHKTEVKESRTYKIENGFLKVDVLMTDSIRLTLKKGDLIHKMAFKILTPLYLIKDDYRILQVSKNQKLTQTDFYEGDDYLLLEFRDWNYNYVIYKVSTNVKTFVSTNYSKFNEFVAFNSNYFLINIETQKALYSNKKQYYGITTYDDLILSQIVMVDLKKNNLFEFNSFKKLNNINSEMTAEDFLKGAQDEILNYFEKDEFNKIWPI